MELGAYKHYKGIDVEVIAIARHSETLDEMVVYKEPNNPEWGESYWVRPKSMFEEQVIVDGVSVPRFKKV
ncbi:MAG: DUF1653 domain-containing protein [Patescibacteria group bacterium]